MGKHKGVISEFMQNIVEKLLIMCNETIFHYPVKKELHSKNGTLLESNSYFVLLPSAGTNG